MIALPDVDAETRAKIDREKFLDEPATLDDWLRAHAGEDGTHDPTNGAGTVFVPGLKVNTPSSSTATSSSATPPATSENTYENEYVGGTWDKAVDKRIKKPHQQKETAQLPDGTSRGATTLIHGNYQTRHEGQLQKAFQTYRIADPGMGSTISKQHRILCLLSLFTANQIRAVDVLYTYTSGARMKPSALQDTSSICPLWFGSVIEISTRHKKGACVGY